jgi:outer membrane receptor for ferrienterochelin and colicin
MRLSGFLSVLLLISSHVHAEIESSDINLEDLIQLELEELTTISVASKKEEAIEDAPGIITVVSAEEIKRYGARNLRDVLDRQTHIQIIGSNTFPHDRVNMRGVSFTHTDNTILLMINGRPIRDAGSTNVNHDLYSTFPVESIKQIEIIRGPGSVLYGTNAYAGVINIITFNAKEQTSTSASITYGSFDTKKAMLQGSVKLKDLEIYAVFNALSTDGDDFHNINAESNTSGTYKTGNKGKNAVFNVHYKNLTINSFISETTQDHARSVFLLPSTELDVKRSYFDIGYKHHFTSNWSVTGNYTYHDQEDKFFIATGSTPQTGGSTNHLFEISSQYNLLNNVGLLAGASYELQESNARRTSAGKDVYIASGYFQIDYKPVDWLKLIAGTQYNKPESVSGNFSNRFAAIFNFNKNWGAKLLYGEAFRNSSRVERFISVPGVVLGDPGLNPETIETIDVQLSYKNKGHSLSATYFHSQQDNLITRTGASPQQIVNSGSIEYDGFELEGKYNIGHGFHFIGNLSYQTNEKNDGSENVTYSPDWMFKTGVSYESDRGYQLSIFNSYFAKSTLQNHQVTTVTATNPDADGYNLLTANLRANLGEVVQHSALSNITFSLYGDNLLDEDIYFPSISRTAVNSIPHHVGRGFYATIEIDF